MSRQLGVKEAAEVLGVHPQTVRGWTRKGFLRAIRLLGSRHRRYTEDEIERVKGLMAGQGVQPHPLGLDDALFELDGAGESGCPSIVDNLHSEIGDAVACQASEGPARTLSRGRRSRRSHARQ